MIIRKFEKKDLPLVLELCREVRNYHIELLNGYFAPQDDRLEQREFLESLESDEITALVAEENDNILGYLLAENRYSAYLVNPKTAHISNIGVRKDFRGKGLGKELMNAFCEICRKNDIDEIRLGVFNKNVSAYNFYEKYGFEPFEQRMKLRIKK